MMNISVLHKAHAGVADAERQLDAAGIAVPAHSRAAWTRHMGSPEDSHLIARDGSGQCVGSVAIHLSPTRAIPGHRVARLESFGDNYATPVGVALLGETVRFSRDHGRILRAVVELECRDASNKAYLHAALENLGFRRIVPERVAERTLVIDLSPSEDAILAQFRKSTRQGVRGASKYALEIVTLDDPAYGPRMTELLEAAMSRTGGQAEKPDWPHIMEMCGALPHRFRLSGVFRGGDRSPASLIGFGWALLHGDRAEYSTGASARLPGESVPILHPILWDLIRWAKREGATWFDLGGVTQGSQVPGAVDPLAGISDFKRGFTKDEIALGEEWIYEPSAFKARVAAVVSRAMQSLRQRRSPSAQAGPTAGSESVSARDRAAVEVQPSLPA